MSASLPSPESNPFAPNIYVAMSNLSLPPEQHFLRGLSGVEKYTQQIGGEGGQVPLEITPTQLTSLMLTPLVAQLVRRGRLVEAYAPTAGALDKFNFTDEGQAVNRLVASVHSSPTDLTQPRLDPVGRILFGHYEQSFLNMALIQKATNKDLPAVLYPDFMEGQIEYDANNAPFQDRSFQPKALGFKKLGLTEESSVEEIEAKMAMRGFTSVTVDVAHIFDEQEGEKFRNPDGLVEKLSAAGLVKAVHWAVGRADVTKGKVEMAKRTADALKASEISADAMENTPEGQMLKMIITNWNTPSLTERSHAMEDRRVVVGLMPQLASTREARKKHMAIVENLRHLIANAPTGY